MKTNFRYHLIALITMALWGSTFVSTKHLICAGLTPSQIYVIRFVVAYAGMWIICLIRQALNPGTFKAFPHLKLRDELLFLLIGLSGGSLYFLAENTALGCTQASNVSFIVTIAPLLTVLLTLFARRIAPDGEYRASLEKVHIGIPLFLGTAMALFGMAIVFFDGAKFQLSLKGDILAFLAALSWAVYSLFMSYAVIRYGSMIATRKSFFYGVLTCLPFVIGEPFDISILSGPYVLFNISFLSIVASLICFLCWNIVMPKIGNVTASNYIYLGPFFTLISAGIFLGERMTLTAWIGSLLIVLGVALVCRK